MKEGPILFSRPMVLAILEGRKLNTRRVVKNQPMPIHSPIKSSLHVGSRGGFKATRREGYWMLSNGECGIGVVNHIGEVGDRLWVRENFSVCYDGPEAYEIIWQADGSRTKFSTAMGTSDEHLDWLENAMNVHGESGRPNIHLPQWASRIKLQIVGTGIHRIQSMTETDAKYEGVENLESFRKLWDELNFKRGYGWGFNPWVWIISFKLESPCPKN